MSSFSSLKTAIQNAIKANGNQEITGNLLQGILLSIVETLGDSAINTLESGLSNEAATRGNADTQLNNLITGVKNNVDNGYVYAGIAIPTTSPVSGKVFYIATKAGTYTNLGGLSVTEGITILKYNGSTWSKEQVIYGDGGVYDVTAQNGGTTFASLEALLGSDSLSTLIPTAVRKGGMSIKFVQTSDNKYVQARCMAQNFTSDVTQWQGVDDKPTAGSDNLVKSGGVDNVIDKIAYTSLVNDIVSNANFNGSNPEIYAASVNYKVAYIPIEIGKSYKIRVHSNSGTATSWYAEFTTKPAIGVTCVDTPYYITVSEGGDGYIEHTAVNTGYFAVSLKGDADAYFSELIESSELKEDIADIKGNIDIIEHSLTDTVKINNIISNANFNGSNTQIYAASANYKIAYIPIEINKSYKIKVHTSSDTVVACWYAEFTTKPAIGVTCVGTPYFIELDDSSDGYVEHIAVNNGYFAISLKGDTNAYSLEMIEVADIKEDIADIKGFEHPLGRFNLSPLFISCFKKISCIGDSLTEGGFDVRYPTVSGTVIKEYSYPTYLEKETGVKTINLGISGYKALKGSNKEWYAEAVNRGWFSQDANNEYPYIGDAVIMALGTNDVSDGWTGDVNSDIDSNNPDNNANTSVGGYARIIQKLKEISPKIVIFCVTIPNERNVGASTKAKAQADIKEMASMFDCYIIDLETYAEPTQTEQDFFINYYKNGGHNNALGYRVRSRQYASYIDWIIYNNIDKFQDIQFIGTDYAY